MRRSALVVDDDTSIRNLVATLLRREGFEVETANDGLEAVLKLGLAEFDVIMLDLMMPLVGGGEIIEFLRNERSDLLRHVIVMTAAADPEVHKLDGCCAVIRKPFDVRDLISIVLEHTRLHDSSAS